jgi:hypothetical protein
MNGLLSYDFDAKHVGGPKDRGIDIEVRLYGDMCTLQCGNWDQRTFSFPKLFERLTRAKAAVFRYNGFKHPIVHIPFPAWMDHLTWERPGEDHARRKLRAFLAYKGLRPQDIEEACRLI